MSSADIGLFLGLLVSAWSAGFSAGYIVTKFRDAINHVI